MTFTVKYRSNDGKIREERIEAANRSECVAKCKAQGIAPISVRDGGVSNAEVQRRGDRRERRERSRLLWLLAGIIVVTIIGIFWLLPFFGDREKPKTANHVVVIKNAPRPNPKASAQNSNIEKPKPIVPSKTISPTSIVEVISVRTNSNGAIIERYRRADGKTAKRISFPPPIFKSASDSVLALIAQVKPGQSMAPLPANPITDEEFLESLKDPIVLEKNDSAEIKALKTSVVALRAEIKALLDQGRSVNEILAEHQAATHHTEALHVEALKEIKRLIDNGERAAAVDYAVEINKKLQDWGLNEIAVPTAENIQNRGNRNDAKD